MKHLVVSGFSGVGKGALTKAMVARYPEEYFISISATTRAPRPGEQNGREYFFISDEEFSSLAHDNGFLEHMQYGKNRYGTLRDFSRFIPGVEKKNIIFEIDVRGGLQIKKNYADAILVFVVPPSVNALYHRLLKRGSETPEEIKTRINRAKEETDFINEYDYILVNDDFEKAIAELLTVDKTKTTPAEEKKRISDAFRTDLSAFIENNFS